MILIAALAGAGCGRRVTDSDGGPGSPEPGEILAEVGSREIRELDVELHLAGIPPLSRQEYATPAGRERLLRQLIEEELLWRAAGDEGISQDPDVAKSLERAARTIIVQAYLDRKQAEFTRIDEEQAREFFEAHQDEYVTERTVRVRLLENPRRELVEHARKLVIDQVASMAEVCSKYNTDANLRSSGGMLPQWIRHGKAAPWIGNHPRFHEVVFALELKEPSAVFETARGWNFTVLEEEKPARNRSFKEARHDVELRISRQRSSTGLPDLLASLEERYGVRIEAPERGAAEVFAEAQRAANPRESVALFEEIVERWPDDERVPEALFMIGFTRSEELRDPKGAAVALRALLERFPDSELAQSAAWMLSSGGDGTPEFEVGETASPEESAP